MEVILLDDVDNLGKLGEVRRVKPGYARNYLLPQNRALLANDENKKTYEQMREKLEQKLLEKKGVIAQKFAKLSDIRLEFTRNASEEGKLYGSVSIGDIVNELLDREINVEKRQVYMADGAIRHTGEFSVEIRLDADNILQIPIEIIATAQE